MPEMSDYERGLARAVVRAFPSGQLHSGLAVAKDVEDNDVTIREIAYFGTDGRTQMTLSNGEVVVDRYTPAEAIDLNGVSGYGTLQAAIQGIRVWQERLQRFRSGTFLSRNPPGGPKASSIDLSGRHNRRGRPKKKKEKKPIPEQDRWDLI